MMRSLVVTQLLAVVAVMAQDPSQPIDWRGSINQGVEAFKYNRYPDAISAFQKASDLNSASPIPHLYLGITWFQQYIPGAASSDNATHARRAETEFRRALDLDPKSWTAHVMLGLISFQEGRLDEARGWYQKAQAVDPGGADIWYALGVVASREWSRDPMKAHLPILEDAISDFEKAVALDPKHEDAMVFLNLLLRARAGMRDSEEERGPDIAAAERWFQKSTDVRSEMVQAAIARIPTAGEPEVADPDLILHQWASLAVRPALPPPPPPPAPSFANGRIVGGPVSAGVISFEPGAAGSEKAPSPIRVEPAVQEQKLTTKANPQYPAGAAEAGVTGTVRLVVVIGKNGRTIQETLISGHPLLVQAAVDAVRQWVYRPTLINGEAVEVVSEVRVEFTH